MKGGMPAIEKRLIENKKDNIGFELNKLEKNEISLLCLLFSFTVFLLMLINKIDHIQNVDSM